MPSAAGGAPDAASTSLPVPAGDELRRGEVLQPVADGQRLPQPGRRVRSPRGAARSRCAGCRSSGPGWTGRRRSAPGRRAATGTSKGRPAAARPAGAARRPPARCTSTTGWNHGSTPRSARRWRSHQATSVAVETPAVRTAGEKASSTTSRTRRLRPSSAAISSGSRVSSQPTARSSADTSRSAHGPSASVTSRCSVCDSPSARAKSADTSMPIRRGAACSTMRRTSAHWDCSPVSRPPPSSGDQAGRNWPPGTGTPRPR
jgi:hypothetical protein